MGPQTRYIVILLIPYLFFGCDNCDDSVEYIQTNQNPEKWVLEMNPYSQGDQFTFEDRDSSFYQMDVVYRYNTKSRLRTDYDHTRTNCDGIEYTLTNYNVTIFNIEFPTKEKEKVWLGLDIYLFKKTDESPQFRIGSLEPLCQIERVYCTPLAWDLSSELDNNADNSFLHFEKIESIQIGNRQIENAYSKSRQYSKDSLISEVVYSAEYGVIRLVSFNRDTLDRVFD